MARYVRGRTYYLRFYAAQTWVAVPAIFRRGYNQYEYRFECPRGWPLRSSQPASSTHIHINPQYQVVMDTPRGLPIWPNTCPAVAGMQYRAVRAFKQGLLTL